MAVEESTLQPNGWIGEPDELTLARRYRRVIILGYPAMAFLVAAYILYWLAYEQPSGLYLGLIVAAMVVWQLIVSNLQQRVSAAIGREWTWSLETKQRRKRDQEEMAARTWKQHLTRALWAVAIAIGVVTLGFVLLIVVLFLTGEI